MHSIRAKFTLLTLGVVMIALSVATAIGVTSLKRLGSNDADQMLYLTATTGAMNLEAYFESVEHSAETVATLVQDSFQGKPFEDLDGQVERARNLFGRIAYNTNGVLTYYFRIDPEISDTVTGFWYVNEDDRGFQEHEVTDITQYDTNDTSALVWFTVPKATGSGVWLPPYYTENLNARVVSYNVPVYWADRFVGVIGIEIAYEMLAREVENIEIFKTGYAFVLDEDSNVIYHPQIDSAKLELETTALNDVDRFIGSNHIQYTYEGTPKEAVWKPLRNGMRLYVTAPVSEIDSAWMTMIRNTLVAALMILAVSCIVTLRFSGYFTKPLLDLAEAAKQADKGSYDFSLEYAEDDEVGILTHTFKELAAHTKEHITEARRMAAVDSLTGAYNKHAYVQREEKINEEIKAGSREPFALVVCDINGLKSVNDLYGHKEGDACIKSACAKICGTFRYSPVFRVGGDEFVVLLSGEDYIRRDSLMEQINAVPEDPSNVRMGETLSAGMAEYQKDRHTSLSGVFEDADRAMYERKQALKVSVLQRQSRGDDPAEPEYIPVIHTRKRILIADDIKLNRELIGNYLQSDYDVLYAADGNETLEVLRSHKDEIDLVLLDLQMPNKDGREVIAEMQVDEDLMSIPVVILTVVQGAELDCLKIGAMDFIPKPYPNIDVVKARIAKCIELSEDRELIRYTERDKLTGLLNKDFFFRYVNRLDHVFKDTVMDAVVCDVNKFHSANKQYGRQFGDRVLRSIGNGVKKLAQETGGIGCRQDGDTFLLYCPHQSNYEQMFREFMSGVFADADIAEKVSLRFGVFTDARQEPNIVDRFVCAKIAADKIKGDPQTLCGYYDFD